MRTHPTFWAPSDRVTNGELQLGRCRNNFNIRYWSWNYRGCWLQTSKTCPEGVRPCGSQNCGWWSNGNHNCSRGPFYFHKHPCWMWEILHLFGHIVSQPTCQLANLFPTRWSSHVYLLINPPPQGRSETFHAQRPSAACRRQVAASSQGTGAKNFVARHELGAGLDGNFGCGSKIGACSLHDPLNMGP